MVDMYEPFDGAERLKRFCKTVDEPKVPLPRYGTPVETVIPRSGLFDIYKRTTNLSENKCVGIGFTYAEATKFIDTRLKPKINHRDAVVTFYEIVAQDNVAARNPLWNPKDIVIENSNVS